MNLKSWYQEAYTYTSIVKENNSFYVTESESQYFDAVSVSQYFEFEGQSGRNHLH